MLGRSVLTRAFQAYTNALRTNPIRTQITASAVLWGLGDAIAQKIEDRGFKTDRWILTTSYGGIFNGTVGHIWYISLDRAVRHIAKPGSLRFVATKVVADCALFGPVHIAAFFTVMTLAEGGPFADVVAKIKKDLLPTLAAELTFWPAIQAWNFAKVPLRYQLLVVNTVTVADAAFMSWAQHNDIAKKVRQLLRLGDQDLPQKTNSAKEYR